MKGTGDRGLVVIGAGLAGVRAVEAARRQGYAGNIVLVGMERHLPYDRPPLSKDFLTHGSEPVFLSTEDELRDDLSVDVRLDSRAESLDTERRTVSVGGEVIPYERLVIATGASPRLLAHLPALPGVETLRTVEDAARIREHLQVGRNVVIVGAGFIGSEIASSALTRGCSVTIVEAAPIPLVRAVGEVIGRALSTLHERNNTRLLCDTQVVEMLGSDHVTGVRLSSGEILDADTVIVGVGAAPATGWLADSGLELNAIDGGLVCDEFMQTSAPGVYAAGDVAHWPNARMDVTMRLENWTNAADQGARAATNALFPETASAYETVPYFWSDWYGNRIQFVGSAMAETVSFVSGGPEEDRFIAVFGTGDRLVGAATLNEPRKIMKLRRLISQRAELDDVHALLEPALQKAPIDGGSS